MALNAAEALVERLATNTFLALWSFPNPLNANGKELCDVLVVCGDVVLLISVKEVRLRTPDGVDDASPIPVDSAEAKRWYRGAIDESVKQLYGAERALDRLPTVRPSGRGEPLAIPRTPTRRVYRVAVALGANGRLPFPPGNFEKGFVHVLDEQRAVGEVSQAFDSECSITSWPSGGCGGPHHEPFDDGRAAVTCRIVDRRQRNPALCGDPHSADG